MQCEREQGVTRAQVNANTVVRSRGCAPRMKRLLRFALNDELTKTLPDWIGLDWMGIRRAIGPMSGLLY